MRRRQDDMAESQGEAGKRVKQMPDFEKIKDHVKMTVTGEGLRVELLETENGNVLRSGNSQPSGDGQELLEKLAEELGKLPTTS